MIVQWLNHIMTTVVVPCYHYRGTTTVYYCLTTVGISWYNRVFTATYKYAAAYTSSCIMVEIPNCVWVFWILTVSHSLLAYLYLQTGPKMEHFYHMAE